MNKDLFFVGFAGESIKLAAQFINPFAGKLPEQKLTPRELQRSIRQALAAEEEAVHFYEAVADATDDDLSKRVLQSIADEERIHAGEFQQLLSKLVANEDELLEKGRKEVDDMTGEKKEAAKPFMPSEYLSKAKTFLGMYRKKPLLDWFKSVPFGTVENFFTTGKIKTANLEKIAPFKSQAQRRKFYAMAARGEISKSTLKKWEKHTPKGKKLPERVKAASVRILPIPGQVPEGSRP